MKIRALIFCLILSGEIIAQDNFTIDWDCSGLSFFDFKTKVESASNYKFFYKDEWVGHLRLSNYPGCKDLQCILDSLFAGTGLYYFIADPGDIIITKGYALFEINDNRDNTKIYLPESDNPVNNAFQVINENAIIEFGKRNNKYSAAILSGSVTESESGDPLSGISVHCKKLSLGTITGANGFYEIQLPAGYNELEFSSIGYTPKTVRVNLFEPGELNISLNKSIVRLGEIIVSADKRKLMDQLEVGVEKINISSGLLKTSLGEKDILRNVALMSGVHTIGEGSAGFNVRGGSADQNLILLHGASIYNSNHFFGFFTSVNSDVISNVTLYKGGIPGRYGGRISSVLDIETREGDQKAFKGSIGLSPVTSHFMVEGPIVQGKLSYLLAARSTYSNWIMDVIKNPMIHNHKASFYDVNAKVTYDINSSDKLDMFVYRSHDYFKFNSNEYKYSNDVYSVIWNHDFNDRLTSKFTLGNSSYGYKIANTELITESYNLYYKISSAILKSEFTLKKTSGFGIEITAYNTLPGRIEAYNDSSAFLNNEIEREEAIESALYFDQKFNILPSLTFSAGIRFSSILSLGPQKMYTYGQGFPKSSSTISDTLQYGSHDIYSKYGGPELRLSMNYKISGNNSIKVNYNRTRQYIHLLSNTASISPTDTWKLCDPYMKPEVGDQYAIGFYQYLSNSNYEFSSELYFKEIRNMIDYKGGSTLTMTDNIEQYVIDAKGKAYGLELSFRKTKGRTQFNIAYTRSRTFLKSTSEFRDETINSGNWYPANYDKPNSLNISYQFQYSRRFIISAEYTYTTGRPITLPMSIYNIGNISLINYSDRNKYRIPDYSRFDISCRISGNLKSRKITNPNLVLSIYNLFGRENAYSVFFRQENNEIKGYKLSIFGRPIPSASLTFDF